MEAGARAGGHRAPEPTTVTEELFGISDKWQQELQRSHGSETNKGEMKGSNWMSAGSCGHAEPPHNEILAAEGTPSQKALGWCYDFCLRGFALMMSSYDGIM